jgi:cyclophilin family peptidyl-prolyl cis-trans isomerase/HEAT repeat protein
MKPSLSAVLSSFLALALAAGCASAPRAAAVDPTAPTISDADLSALLLLQVDRQIYEPFTVRRALARGPGVREALAVALGRIPGKAGRPILEGLLIDEAPAVRRAAAFGLGELEDPAAKEPLLAAAVDPDSETGLLAVEALGKLKVPVIEVVERLLPLPEGERWARLLPPLFRFHEENAITLAERGLARPEPELHAHAAYALARDPFPQAAPILRPLLSDGDPLVRAWAARGLGLVGGAGDAERLVPLFTDTAAGPTIQALRSARTLILAKKDPPPAAARPLLLDLLRDPRAGVRVTAIEAAAAWLPDSRLSEALIAFAAGGEGRERGNALVALATGGSDARTAALVQQAAASSDADVRSRAAEAAAKLGPAGHAVLVQLAADPSPEVRQAALAVRLELGDEAAAVAARAALEDADAAVRGVGLDWLAEHGAEVKKIPLERMTELVTAAVADDSPESGLSAIKAVVSLAEGEPLLRGALVVLLEKAAAGSHDYAVRREAGAALGRLGQPDPGPGPAGPLRNAAVYRQILESTERPRSVAVRTARGTFHIRLACPEAPLNCLNFLQLAAQGYFDGLTFHRVVPDFVVQGGDPRGDGSGGPGYTVRDEINRLRYRRGAVGMALAGPDTGGSQFFVALSPQPHLDGGYTVFGEVTDGMEVVDQLQADDRIEKVEEVEK